MIVIIGSFSKRHNSTKQPVVLVINSQTEDFTFQDNEWIVLSVDATGEGLTYQWQYQYPNQAWTNWPSGTTASITKQFHSSYDGLKNRCIITDMYGNQIITREITARLANNEITIINHQESIEAANSWGTLLSDVELKEDCSMEEPVFRIGFSNWDPAYNYIYVPSWGRYYFVIDVTVRIGRIWEVSCRLDAAATYKADVTTGNQYIIYAAAANTEIIDARIPIKTTKSIDYVDSPLSDYCNTTGTYMLTVSGSGEVPGTTNGPTTYALSLGALNNVMSSVKNYINNLGSADTDTFEAILTIGRQLVGCGNIGQNILGCTWIPWNVTAMGDVANEGIYLGVFDTGKAGFAIGGAVKSYTTSISIPWQVSDWRRNSPYTQVYLYIPFVGIVQLSSENLINESVLSVTVSINRINGNCNFQVAAGNQIIGTYSAATGIGIPVGASGISGETAAIGAIAHTASMVAGVAGSHLLAAGAGAVAAVSHIAPNSITAGNLSGGAAVGLGLNLRCYTVFHDTVVAPSVLRATVGEPVNTSAALSSFSGFVQTQNASIQGANMSDAVRQELNSMCDNGIFIE